MKRFLGLIAFSCLPALLPAVFAQAQSPSAETVAVLEKVGVRRGICVVLSDPQSPLALELARASELLVYVQLPAADRVEAVRQAADRQGLLGKRVFVEQGVWSHLHLADNLADAVVVQDAEQGRPSVPMTEILRVLRPGGKALVGAEQIVKPYPETTDDWSHPYHGPDNNPQSNDQLARAPYLTHFLAEPWYSPMPLVTVASGGRLF